MFISGLFAKRKGTNMHGTQLGPGYRTPVRALGPNSGTTSAPAGAASNVARSPQPDDDPRTKNYIDG